MHTYSLYLYILYILVGRKAVDHDERNSDNPGRKNEARGRPDGGQSRYEAAFGLEWSLLWRLAPTAKRFLALEILCPKQHDARSSFGYRSTPEICSHAIVRIERNPPVHAQIRRTPIVIAIPIQYGYHKKDRLWRRGEDSPGGEGWEKLVTHDVGRNGWACEKCWRSPNGCMIELEIKSGAKR